MPNRGPRVGGGLSGRRNSVLRMGNPALRAVVAGLMLASSVPPWGFWPLGFVGMALWVELLADTKPAQRAGRSALIAVSWLAPTTFWMVDLTVLGWPIAVLAFAAMHACAAALVPAKRRQVAFPAAFALAELLRWSWPFGGVPLATMAMAQVAGPMAPVARVGGPLLLTALVAVAGVTLAAIAALEFKPALASLAVVAAAGAVTAVAPGAQPVGADGDEDKALVVAAVQGGGPQNSRADICEQRAVFERHVRATREQVIKPVDLIVWPEDVVHPSPETAVRPTRCVEPLLRDSEARAELSALARDFDATLVAGFFERSADGGANRNYVAAYDPQGVPVDVYDKVHLVPFGEYVPLRSTVEGFSDELPPRDVRRGDADEPAVLETPVGTLGVSISWEIFFEHRARSAIGDGGGQVLLNPTNGSSYWLTMVQSQQIASSRLRAIETGRWVIQAAPTGFSAVVNPDGVVIERSGVSEAKVIQRTVTLRDGDTLAVRLGVWPAAVAAALTLSLALGLGRVLKRPRPGRKQ